MAGGLILRDTSVAEEVRRMVREAPADIPEVRQWMRGIIHRAYARETQLPEILFLDSAYELLLKFYRPDRNDLAGFPLSVPAICDIGEQRRERVSFLRNTLGRQAVSSSFWAEDELLLPFAFPYFGNGNVESLQSINHALEASQIYAGIYRLDVRRNMYHPEYKPCVLLPCHQHISMQQMAEMCEIVLHNDQ